MASNICLWNLAAVVFAFAIFVQGTLGGIECEKLGEESCAFAVSSSGKRCVLEKQVKRTGEEAYTCKTSEIEADKAKDHIETDQCVEACGLDRKSLGISSDSLLESHFIQSLCSPQCYKSCENIVDLYFNLAAGEGVFLPKLCEANRADNRRGMSELRSSGFAAPGPVKAVNFFASSPEPGQPAKFTSEANGANARRGMAELRSSGIVAPGPGQSVKVVPPSSYPSSYIVAPGPVQSVKVVPPSSY